MTIRQQYEDAHSAWSESEEQLHQALKETACLRETLQDIRDGERIILEEKCASDEIHCGCVPTLRGEIDRLMKAQGVA